MKKNHMWCLQNEKTGKLVKFTVVEDIQVIGFVSRKGLKTYHIGSGPISELTKAGFRIVKIEFRVPRVPKAKKVTRKKR